MSAPSRRVDDSPSPLTPLPRPELSLGPLPNPVTPLFGRERERADLLTMLADPATRLVVLTGPGGIGKTRVALDVAHSLGEVFDGVAFVALAAIFDPALVLPTIAREIGVAERSGHALIESMSRAIGERHVLLVLDNFEQVAPAAPVVGQLLARCPRLSLLVTSRVHLGLTAESCYPVTALPLPAMSDDKERLAANAAVTLFARGVRANHPGFMVNAETSTWVVEICRQLEGWPLALELAAARTAALSLPELLARAHHPLSFLTSTAVDRETRFRSMRDAIAWSVDLLDPGEVAAFSQLAVFSGGFDLDAATAVIVTETGQDALSLLESLVHKSLVKLESLLAIDSRYTMLETIREYAAERLGTGLEAKAAREQHAGWYLDQFRIGRWCLKSEQAAIWIARFNANRENLRSALNWLHATKHQVLFLELAWSLAVFWDYQGELMEGRRWLEQALLPFEGATEPAEHLAPALTWLGWLQVRLGNYPDALHVLERALPMWSQLGSVNGIAYTHVNLGAVDRATGDLAASRRHFELAYQLFQEVNEGPGMVEAIINLSDLDVQTGRLQSALERARCGLSLSFEISSQTYQATSRVTVAQALIATGDLSGALETSKEAFEGACALGFTVCAADAIACVAAVACRRGELELAANLLGAASRWLAKTGSASFFLQDQFARTLEQVQQGLGRTRFERAWTEGMERPDAAIGDLIARVGSSHVVTSPGRNLTAREHEVLVLLAAGKSDREIASELFITYRTANSYVARVLAKLDVPSRTAAAALAIREQLV